MGLLKVDQITPFVIFSKLNMNIWRYSCLYVKHKEETPILLYCILKSYKTLKNWHINTELSPL